ncbi:hypothetical protein J6590_051544 [Homalodisca vitripennis]|nr:hypothetical protein J6590_051544 [Homalodisca vitripennis]
MVNSLLLYEHRAGLLWFVDELKSERSECCGSERISTCKGPANRERGRKCRAGQRQCVSMSRYSTLTTARSAPLRRTLALLSQLGRLVRNNPSTWFFHFTITIVVAFRVAASLISLSPRRAPVCLPWVTHPLHRSAK